MPKGEHLGEFEQLVLLAVAAAGEDAVGRSIYEEILRSAGRDTSITAVHVTLARLEEKGYVSSRFGYPGDSRRGRPRKIFGLEAVGVRALKDARQAFDELWKSAALHPGLREG